MAAVAGERILICADMARFYDHPFCDDVSASLDER